MAIKFSQFNLRTDHTSGMYLVGYDGNQNIHITVDNLFDDFINGTENTIAMFGTDGTELADSILSQDAGATLLTVAGQLNVDAAATFDTSITVTGDSTLNGNVALGDTGTDLITQTGTLYLNGPIKDTTNTLGIDEQILVSDAIGELTFRDLDDTTVGKAEAVVQTIKCNEAIPKGCPVYIVGFQPGENANIVEKADASNPAKMPATGVADDDYAAQDFGTMTAFGSFNGDFDTTGGTENWSIGDILYVKPGGGLTNIKPTGTNLIQNIAIVSRVQSQTGEMEVIALGRTNDIPNLTPGRLWAGSTGNTIESQTLFVDEANGRLGINEASPGYSLDVDGTLQTSGWAYFATSGPSSLAQVGGGSTTTSQFNIISTATGGSFIAATNTLTLKTNNVSAIKIDNAAAVQFNQYGVGVYTGTAARNLSVDSSGNVIETAAVPANIVETITTTDGTYINLTPNSPTDGAVTVTADLSATGTADATKYLRGDNTWSPISGIYDWDISDGTNSETIVNGDTVTFSGNTYITTTYATATNTLSIDHDDTTRADTTSSDSPAFGGTFEAVTSVTTNTTGHVTAIDVSTVTLPTPVNYSWAITADTGISQTVLNGNTVDIAGGTYISTVVGATDTVTVNHDTTTRTNTASSASPGVGGNFTAVDSVTTNSTGHVTGLNLKTVTLPDDGIDGSGTLNYVAKFTPDGDTIGDSVIYDDGTNIGIGTNSPSSKLEVNGNVTANRYYGTGSTTYYVDPNDTTQAAYFAGDIRITDSGTATIKLDSTSIYPGASIVATKNGSESPPLGSITWVENPGFQGTTWAQRLSLSPYTESAIQLPTSSSYDFSIKVLGSNRMTIDSSTGNVGIGTTSPGAKLDINNDVHIDTYNAGTTSPHNAGYIKLLSDGKTGWAPGDELGKIEFYSVDGSGIGARNAASIRAVNNQGNGSSTTTFEGELAFYTSLHNTAEAEAVRIDSSGNVGIGTTSPASKLDVNGGIRMADDSSTASASNVGTLRYRTSGNNSYVDMCMQTGASTYAWVNIVQNNW